MLTKAVFLDRDGTINIEVEYLRHVKQLRMLSGVAGAIKELNMLGFLVVVLTNQAVIARGWLSEKGLDEIHAVMIKRLGRYGAKIDAIYYCPHHPNADLKKYKMECRCRKPNVGMIIDAVKKYKIDRKKSFMIGDTTRDILAGKKARLRTILVKTGYAGEDGKHEINPDFVAKDLRGAVKVIKNHKS
jgi:mannose-1-phosphate guanylyltransferase / phosphomannomutase